MPDKARSCPRKGQINSGSAHKVVPDRHGEGVVGIIDLSITGGRENIKEVRPLRPGV
jgi:hypothetical protein